MSSSFPVIRSVQIIVLTLYIAMIWAVITKNYFPLNMFVFRLPKNYFSDGMTSVNLVDKILELLRPDD